MLKRILLIEPYYGGSHKHFLDGLSANIPADFSLLSLPPRKWKMRMQLAAPWFVKQIRAMPSGNRCFDSVVFSTFIDVAVFKALVQKLEGWNTNCTCLTYFHENQFEYPGVLPKESNHQFTAINFTTALVSDGLAFNSAYNRSSFFGNCRSYIANAADIDLENVVDELEEKSIVLYPGIDFKSQDGVRRKDTNSGIPLIIWNHRWEHDKNPEEFFDALLLLKDRGVSFRLALLGQSFRKSPSCFREAQARLEERIIHFGYLEDRQEYYRMLAQGDVVVSTAHHEFFGISVIEAVRAGCVPVLPPRLSYPELFANHYFYGDDSLADHLERVLLENRRLSIEQRELMTNRFSWPALSTAYENWLGIEKKRAIEV